MVMNASSKAAPTGQASALWMSTIAFTACLTIGRFVNGASDEEWLTGQMSRAQDPGRVFLRRPPSSALSLPRGA
jgi:hypothetical protein